MRATWSARAAAKSKASLRAQHNTSVRQIVDKLNLREALVDAGTMNRLRQAGYRSQNALNIFLFARFVLPFVFFAVGAFYIFYLGYLGDKPLSIRILAAIGIAYLGFYAPNIYISNRISKRQLSIKRAWPDALDLLLICVESGVSMEVALRRTYDATPDPKLVVAVGDCGACGGIFGTGYASLGAVSNVIPVDVVVPGCPPTPARLMQGILTAISLPHVAASRPPAP